MKKTIKTLSKGLQTVAQIILLIMMLIITFDVLGRWLFHHPIKGTVDITEIALSMVVFFSIGYAHLKKVHITIDFVVDKFSNKVQLVFDSVINVVIATVMGVVTWSLWQNAQRLMNSNTVSSDLNIPIHIISILAAIGTAIFALIAILISIESVQKLTKTKEVSVKNSTSNNAFGKEAVNSNES
ncbi:MAG TPA: TRAP transporter small permease [Bacillales bacterium]|nr:TRAP transporter small permease [Bacillales bacterium]